MHEKIEDIDENFIKKPVYLVPVTLYHLEFIKGKYYYIQY